MNQDQDNQDNQVTIHYPLLTNFQWEWETRLTILSKKQDIIIQLCKKVGWRKRKVLALAKGTVSEWKRFNCLVVKNKQDPMIPYNCLPFGLPIYRLSKSVSVACANGGHFAISHLLWRDMFFPNFCHKRRANDFTPVQWISNTRIAWRRHELEWHLGKTLVLHVLGAIRCAIPLSLCEILFEYAFLD